MKKTRAEVAEIARRFAKQYVFNAFYKGYLNLVFSEERDGNWCLIVGFTKPLPPDLKVPDEYEGLKVRLEKNGGFEARGVGWSPDQDFIKFLEYLEKKDGEAITLNGELVIEQIKYGTEFGKKMYEHFYKDQYLQKAYAKWKKRGCQ